MKKVHEEAAEVKDENGVKAMVDKVVNVFKGIRREQLSPTIQKNV